MTTLQQTPSKLDQIKAEKKDLLAFCNDRSLSRMFSENELFARCACLSGCATFYYFQFNFVSSRSDD
jgi:hypothetical protein